jgi:glycerol-3-phosphate dehydrogenase
VIIGGGATGLGIAVDAVTRGYKTLLLEQSDFAKGTSSRSTKLIHGGVRYLAQGNIKLVFDALRERGILLRNAPHLVNKKLFVIPCYSLFEKIKYFVGLKLYDWLAGPLSFGSSKYIGRKKLLELFPNINSYNLHGGVTYFDGQFDDARLAMSLTQTAAENGAVVLNYCKVVSLKKENGKLAGLTAIDVEEEKEYSIKAKAIINATGVFVDAILKMDEKDKRNLVRPSQGVHIVVDKSFLKGDNSLLIPKTPDGRVLFAVPWLDHLLIGTTDTPLQQHTLEPKALESEVNFIIETVAQYLKNAPQKKDILTVFAGLRPLAASQDDNDKKTKEISRDHKIIVNRSGLITITGGKWTTYRKMAVDAIEAAIKNNLLPPSSSKTTKLHLHGYTNTNDETHLAVYGSDAEKIRALWKEHEWTKEKLIVSMPYTKAEVVWCIREEMARTVEDILARRLRILFLNANAAIEAAPIVAEILQNELNKSEEWKQKKLKDFIELAKAYLV